MACATIVKNAVASSSHQTLDPPPAPLLEHIAMPTPADYAEHDAHKKAKRKKTCRGNKKAKKGKMSRFSMRNLWGIPLLKIGRCYSSLIHEDITTMTKR